MFKIIPAALFFLSFFASLVSNAVLRRISIKYNFLIDSPNNKTKLHHKGTPATGGLAISIGIIFSCFFLFAFTDPDYFIDISSERFIGTQETETFSKSNAYKIELENGIRLEIEKFNDESFTITLPSGEKRLYTVLSDQNYRGESSYTILNESTNSQIQITNFSIGLIFFTLLVQAVMVFDDLWGLNAKSRLLLQAICVGGLIFISGEYITSLGNLFGIGELNLGLMGIPFTIFCVVGIMNAFNMMDGINGLCASLCLICFFSVIYLAESKDFIRIFPLIIPIGAIAGFLMYNLGLLGDRTVFLGDNGSNALGFLCAWVLIYFSNNENEIIAPVTALWLVAIPFVDAVGVIISRLLKKLKVLNSYRDHVHHRLLAKNLSEETVFSVLILASGFLAFVGLYFDKNYSTQIFYSFYSFLLFWLCYYLFIKRISKNV